MSDSIVFGNPVYGRLIARAAGTHYNEVCDVCIARERNGGLMGGVVFQGYTHESIGIHSASFHSRWINRDLLWATFNYPFEQLKVKRLFGQVPEKNLQALAFNRNLGFRSIARIPGVYRGGEACIVMVMERDECRFLGVKPRSLVSNKEAHDGRKIQSSPAS